MALAGELLFAGQGPRLIALDVSDPADPRQAGESDALPGLVENVIVRDGIAYITAGKMLLQLDVRDPAHIIHQGQTELPAPGHILLRDDIIYAGGRTAEQRGAGGTTYESFMATVDVSGEPALLDVVDVPYDVFTLAIAGDQLYIGHDQGISRLDVSDPARIAEPVQGPPVTEPYRLRVYGDTLLVGGYLELIAFDVSDPQAPERIWTEENPELGTVRDFAVANDRTYTVGWQPAGAFIPTSVTVPIAEPLPEPAYQATAGSVGIIAAEGRLYRMDRRTLSIESENDGDPALLGAYTALSGGDIVIDEETLFAANRDWILLSRLDNDYVDAYRLPALSLIDRHTFPAVGQEGTAGLSTITLYGDNLYLSGSMELRIVSGDILAPLGAVLSTSQDELIILGQQALRRTSIPVVNAIAYLDGSSGGTEYIVRFDVSDPATIVELDRTPLRPNLRVVDMDATADWLALSLDSTLEGGRDSLALYDLTGEAPALATEIEVAGAPSEIKIGDNSLLAGGGDLAGEANAGLEIYSLPDLALLGQAEMPTVHEIDLLGNLALLTMKQDARLLAVDLGDPANPRIVGAFDLPDGEGEIAAADPFVVVGSEAMGLFLLHPGR